MRSSKSRSRSKSNRQRSIGNIINRVFDSSGPEGKVRGTPQQIIDKYLMLARDAQLSNDRVAEQNFLQHAEHYTRMLGEAQREMAREQESRQQQGQPQQGQPQQGYPQGQYAQGQGGQYPAQGGNGNGHGHANGNGHTQPYQPRERDVRPAEDQLPELPPVIAVAEEEVSSLVETPESQPARPRREPRRPRSDAPKPRPEPAAEPEADAAPAPAEAPEAAAPKAEKPARPRSRSPRKPRGEGKDAAPEASNE